MSAPDSFFRSGEIRLRYRDEGTGLPVVFIHGWTFDLDVWDPQTAEIGRSMRVVRLDRRGFGLSEGTPSIAADAGDLLALVDHLQIARAAFVGMSQGARVALAFALRFPDRVASLVLDGPPGELGNPGSMADEDFSLEAFRELVRSGGLAEFRRQWQDHPLMQLHSGDAGARQLLTRMLERYPGRDLLGAAPESLPCTDADALARFGKPVLVVNGRLDTKARLQAGDQLTRLLPLAERGLIANAGHLPNLDNPVVYNAIVQTFARRQSRAAA